MVIYSDKKNGYEYTTYNLLFNEPCIISGLGALYPVTISECKEYQILSSFLLYTKKHLGVKKNKEILKATISNFAVSMCKTEEELPEKIFYAIEYMKRLFSIITKKEISYRETKDEQYFYGEDVLITSANFDAFRKTVLKMNVQSELKYFKDKEVEEWYYKALKANSRGSKKSTLEDKILQVSVLLNYRLEEIKNMNIFQLESYYTRACYNKSIDKFEMYKCHTSEPKKIPDLNYTDPIIEDLYKDKNTLDSMLMSENELKGML